MDRVLVIGAGFMGAGIAQVCAQSGCRVFLTDSNAEALEKAVGGIKWSVEKLAKKGFVSEEPDKVFERLSPVQGLGKAAESDWVVEAVIEEEGLKKEIFAELDRLAPAGTPLASNTSSIPISRLASATQSPRKTLRIALQQTASVSFLSASRRGSVARLSCSGPNPWADAKRTVGSLSFRPPSRTSTDRLSPSSPRAFAALRRMMGS